MSISGFSKTTIGGITPSNPLPVDIVSGGNDISVLIVEDSTGTKYIRREVINEEGTVAISYENFDGTPATPVAPITVASTVLPLGASTSAKQDELQGVQGTGTSYNPPTGGSGVFGWLSGTYKELVSGVKLKLGGSDVSSSNPVPIAYSTATITSRSGTITLGGTAQSFMSANTARKGWFIQNNSTGDLWVNRFGGTASAAQPSILIRAGKLYETPAGGSGGNALSIFGATAGQSFTAGEW